MIAKPATLPELIRPIPAERTAIVLPDHDIRVTYGELCAQVEALAESLAAAGVGRGDRVGIALPNGLPMVVSFLAAATVGTAAPLNPAYKEEEFRFYLDDTSAKVLILPPSGAEEARRAAGDRVPITRPKQIHITDAIPRTATGKVQRGVAAKAFSSSSAS